jgi:hypothetical protein
MASQEVSWLQRGTLTVFLQALIAGCGIGEDLSLEAAI